MPKKQKHEDKIPIYCASMWKSIHLDVDGYLTPCCAFVGEENKHTKITDVEKVEEVSQKEFEPYREQMRKGYWPKGCVECKFAEEEGRLSKRLEHLEYVDYMFTDPEDLELEYLQLKTGRECNLECTICNAGNSTAIARRELKDGKITQRIFDLYEKGDRWATDVLEYNKINPNKDYFRIDISGGEPLMNPQHLEWLDKLKNPHLTDLFYSTNGTIIPTEKTIQIWEKFKSICISFSIDSYGEKFEKLRVNANWDKVLSNMKYITEKIVRDRLTLQDSRTVVLMTIHNKNVNDIFDLYEILYNEIDWKNKIDFMNYNYLFNPSQVAIHRMSKMDLKNTISNYETNLHKLSEGSNIRKEAEKLLTQMIDFKNGKEFKYGSLENKFLRYANTDYAEGPWLGTPMEAMDPTMGPTGPLPWEINPDDYVYNEYTGKLDKKIVSDHWTLDKLKSIEIELSSECNAGCPHCPRYFYNTPNVLPFLDTGSISLKQFKTWIPVKVLKNLESITMCGNFGDPCMAPDIISILEYLENCNMPMIRINTNGGMRTTKFWEQMGKIFARNKKWRMIFSVDGLEDTNHLYRRNVKWDKIENHITTFTKQGGYAEWEFLLFGHNEHQIDEARKLSKKWGVKVFIPKKAAGVDNGKQLAAIPALDKKGEVEYWIEPPKNPKNRSLEIPEVDGVERFFQEEVELLYKSMDYKMKKRSNEFAIGDDQQLIEVTPEEKLIVDKSEIDCKFTDRIFIDSQGMVMPCCWIGMQLPHMRGFSTIKKPTMELFQLFAIKDKNGLAKDIDEFDLTKTTLRKILDGGWLNRIFADKWTLPSCDVGKSIFCSKICGVHNVTDDFFTHPGNARTNKDEW
tara:strand:- start:194 stop:2752 length:2559 start_codon:yes stop_codon:yes gene_type:complete